MKKLHVKIFLFIIFLLASLLSYFIFHNSNDTITPDEVELFNKILYEAKDVEAVSSCSKIWNKELEKICETQLKHRFSVSFWVTNLWFCHSPDLVEESQKDLCILNLALNTVWKEKDTRFCNEIKSEEIKSICFSQINSLNF